MSLMSGRSVPCLTTGAGNLKQETELHESQGLFQPLPVSSLEELTSFLIPFDFDVI